LFNVTCVTPGMYKDIKFSVVVPVGNNKGLAANQHSSKADEKHVVCYVL